MSAGALRRGAPDQPLFLFDVAVPDAWPVAERVLTALPTMAEWVPVAYGADPAPDWEAVAARAVAAGALPLQVPASWPPDSTPAMRALAYARLLGKTVAFAFALFRQAYAAGRALDAFDTLALAGAAAEVHPRALSVSLDQRGTVRALAETTGAARAAGVSRVPAIVLPDGTVREGPDCLEAAACAPGTATS